MSFATTKVKAFEFSASTIERYHISEKYNTKVQWPRWGIKTWDLIFKLTYSDILTAWFLVVEANLKKLIGKKCVSKRTCRYTLGSKLSSTARGPILMGMFHNILLMDHFLVMMMCVYTRQNRVRTLLHY